MSHQHTDLITSIQNNSGSNTNNYEQKNIINKEEEFNSSQHKEHACKIVYYSKDDVDNNQIVIKECAKELSKGNLVSFPTETVYGLGALVSIPEAVRNIFVAKRRPFTDPIISHYYDIEDAKKMIDKEELSHIQPVFDFLGKNFWPGPLTIVCLASKEVTSLLTANTGYIGLRIPIHPVARALLKEVQPIGIGAPSANRFGHVSPTKAIHVVEDLGSESNITVIEVDQNFKEFSCGVGIESTVVKLQYNQEQNNIILTVLRRGGISVEELQRSLSLFNENNNLNITFNVENHKVRNDTEQGIVAPGQMITHYSPYIPSYILEKSTEENIKIMNRSISLVSESVIIDFGQSLKELENQCLKYIDLSIDGNIEEARTNIFQYLRDAEKYTDAKVIVLPNMNIYTGKIEHADACHDRLFRAASGQNCIIQNGYILI